MAAFDLGLALVSFVVVAALPGHLDWVVAVLAAMGMLIGAHVTSRFEPPAEDLVRRLSRRTLVPLLVAFPATALAIALLLAAAKGIEGLGFVPPFFLVAFVLGVSKFGLPALIVTALWSLAYVGVERRVAR
jgi:hypothetical protein